METSAHTRNRIKGLYITFVEGEGPASMRFAIVEATPSGTLVVRGESDDSLRVILSQLTEYQSDEIMDLVTQFRKIA